DTDSVPPVKNWLDRDEDVRLQEGVKGKDEEINEQQGINNIDMQEGNSDETTPSKPSGFEEKMKDGQETSEKIEGESNEVQKCSFFEN
nr:RNA-directed DNA polymerase, eukaryota [Tanacetum cinerariifolium]